MYRIIPFQEIDKNKWNGTIHYAINGNVFGYYWFLKAVIGEWDAIVEEDYQSVMPIFTKPLNAYQYDLLKELGPYSVNPLTDQRVDAMLELFQKSNRSSQYPLHSQISKRQIDGFKYSIRSKAVLSAGSIYDQLSQSYSDELAKNLDVDGYGSVKISSGLKPEILVSLLDESEAHKNALMRLMYNSMHRGIGFSSAIEEKETGKILAASFFINTNSTMMEVLSFKKGGKKYRQLIFDLLLRNSSGSPLRYVTFFEVDELHEMGFDSEPIHDIQLKTSPLMSLRKSLGRAH
jgi:hypothetical protein